MVGQYLKGYLKYRHQAENRKVSEEEETYLRICRRTLNELIALEMKGGLGHTQAEVSFEEMYEKELLRLESAD